MREVIFDTETTGLDPLTGHRIVELGCVELFNYVATGKHFHTYLNPQRAVPKEAAMVHGLSDEFLADKPLFEEKVEEFLKFVGDAPLVAHNASFDASFINAELTRLGFPPYPKDRFTDTLAMARRMFPGAPASLDALCKRFGVDLSDRKDHGALLDSQLLAEVYVELRGGRQTNLAINPDVISVEEIVQQRTRDYRAPRPHAATEDERAAHEEFLHQIKDPMWKRAG